jgi:hypothetical protein
LYTPTDAQPQNFYQQDDESFFRRFKVYRFPAVIEASYDDEGYLTDGASAWPERWPFETLKEEQHLNRLVFRIERQVDDSPVEDERSLIRFSKILQSEAKAEHPVCFVDPSSGGDEFAYCIAGLVRTDNGTRLHVQRLGGWRGLPADEAVRELLDVLHEQKISRVKVEENFSIEPILRAQSKERNQNLVIDGFKTTGRKEQRAQGKAAEPPELGARLV